MCVVTKKNKKKTIQIAIEKIPSTKMKSDNITERIWNIKLYNILLISLLIRKIRNSMIKAVFLWLVFYSSAQKNSFKGFYY